MEDGWMDVDKECAWGGMDDLASVAEEFSRCRGMRRRLDEKEPAQGVARLAVILS